MPKPRTTMELGGAADIILNSRHAASCAHEGNGNTLSGGAINHTRVAENHLLTANAASLGGAIVCGD